MLNASRDRNINVEGGDVYDSFYRVFIFRVISISIEVKNKGSYNRFYKRSWISTVVGFMRTAAYNLCGLLLFLFLIAHRSRAWNASLFY